LAKNNCFQRKKPGGENPEDEFKTGDPTETEALNQPPDEQQQTGKAAADRIAKAEE
jgi:hypothetical protein